MSVFSSQPCASNQILSNSIFNQWIPKEHLLFSFPSRRNVEQEALIENRCKLRSQLAFSRQLEVKWGWRVWKGNIQPVWVELTISLLELMVLWNHISQILLRFDAISARWDVWTQTFFPAQNGQWPVRRIQNSWMQGNAKSSITKRRSFPKSSTQWSCRPNLGQITTEAIQRTNAWFEDSSLFA